MYLAKYGHQDVTRIQHEPTVELKAWAKALEGLMQEERENMERER